MYERTKVCTAALLAIAGGAAMAQAVERIEITGSAIRRIDSESSLPVQVLKKEDIQRSGVTSTVDLLRQLPTIQGSTGESASVGGQTYGFSGVSIHNIGETRTLVLLNGHRLSLFGGQTLTGFAAGFDLNSIPVSAIERVEVLTDGASALYGADAIAGVVNFITKRDTTYGDATIGYSAPTGGAKEKRISATKGFGSLASDGWNLIVSFSHDERTQLNSTQRDFAKSGRVFFSQDGKNYRFQQYSASPIPANVLDDNGNLINPYLRRTGSCPDKTFRVIDGTDDFCGFDFVGELEIYPVRKRDAGMGSFTARVAGQEIFADLLVSRTQQTSRIAPVPGSISIPASSPLFTQYLAPLGITQDTRAFYRVYDLGKRTSDDKAEFYDLTLGSRGSLGNFDYQATLTHSESKVSGSISGYPGARALSAVRSSGLLDPFKLVGEQTPAAQAALNGANYKGYWDGGKAELTTLAVNASTELFKLSGGGAQLGFGANVNQEKFQSRPSLFAQGKLANPVAGTPCGGAVLCDQRFGDSATTVPYSADRTSYGVFSEVNLPVLKELEVNLALRGDHFSDFGNATTAKSSFRWKPASSFLVRGSVGTGFHAPSVPQVNAAQQPYGVTSAKYTCTAALQQVATSLGAVCRPASAQYDQIAGGNRNLRPEKSEQATIGLRFEPVPEVSIGADLWWVGIRDTFGQLPERTVFGNPLQYSASWGTNLDIATNTTYLAFKADNQNLGKQFSTGLDLDISATGKTPIGAVTSKLNVTYMIREVAQQLPNGPYYTAVGDYGSNVGGATLRYQGRWATSMKTGGLTNTLGVNFKAGYLDAAESAEILGANGQVTGTEDVRIKVKPFFTLDWQTRFDWGPVTVSLGVLNLADKNPPFTLSTSGTNRSQAFGFDDRYYDPRGRTWYGNLTYRF